MLLTGLLTTLGWLAALVLCGYNVLMCCSIHAEIGGQQSISKGLRQALFRGQDYFRLWDIVRTVASLPAILLALMAVALESTFVDYLVPSLRRILGWKLFKF